MTAKEETALQAVYEQWPIERLARAASLKKGEYQPRAVELMLAELRRRGIDDARLANFVATAPPPIAAKNEARGGTAFFPATLNRKQYFLRWITWVTGFIGVAALLELVPSIQPVAFVIWLLAGLTYKIVGLDIPRVKNAGSSPWLLLLLLVPIANLGIIVFLFAVPPEK